MNKKLLARELLLVAKEIVADDFTTSFNSFLEYCQNMINKHMIEEFPTLIVPQLVPQEGKRFIKIVSITKADNRLVSRSAWGFVDKTNGDILKPASWNTPAKHARGNIYDPNSWKTVTSYGPAYIRRGI